MKYISINGKIVEEEKAAIPITNKANFFDFGIYESIKVMKKKAFHPEFNVERLFSSARVIDLKINYSEEEILKWIKELIKANEIENALLRIMVLGETENQPLKIYIFALNFHFYPKKFYSQGVKVITVKGERYLPEAKTLNMLFNFIALKEAFKQNAVEALLVDNNNCITEGTRSNFFAIRESTIITSPKKSVLEGTTRKILQIQAKNFEIKEDKIKLSELHKYDEFFITSTVFGILPVNQINNETFEVGEKSKDLIRLFRNYSKEYFSEFTKTSQN